MPKAETQPLELGIDTGLLLTEQHGKARHLHAILAALATRDDVQTTLLCSDEQLDTVAARYSHSSLSVDSYRSARRDAYDVVWYPWSTANFPTKSPTVLSINELFAFTAPAKNFFTRRREQHTLRNAARQAEALIAPSECLRDLSGELLDVDDAALSIIRPVPDPAWYPALDPLPFSELADMPYILVVPEPRGKQNLPLFFEAFARAYRKRDISVAICGTVPEKAQRSFRKIPHRHTVTANETELRALYRNAAAVAVPATHEAFHFTAIEASACGAALITANTPTLLEALGDTSLSIDAKERDAWIEGLELIIDDPALNAKLRAQAVNRWNATARTAPLEQLLSILRSCAGRDTYT